MQTLFAPKSLIIAMVAGGLLMAGPRAEAGEFNNVTDESIETAIAAGIDYFKRTQNQWGHWEQSNDPPEYQPGRRDYYGANTIMACLAMLYAGVDPDNELLAGPLSWLTETPIHATYTYGLRAHVFALAPRSRYRKALIRDVQWLVEAVGRERHGKYAGTYDYITRPDGSRNRYDNSNSQYGLLGVWAAALAGVEIPDQYWRLIERHWLTCQNNDGGWCYTDKGRPSYGSMSAAGLASLFVVLDQLYASRTACGNFRRCRELIRGIDKGLDWFNKHYAGNTNPGRGSAHLFYYLYGVERVGLASGRKYFNQHDWFKQGASYLLGRQGVNGSWGGSGAQSNVHTAYAIMFLCRGRAPVLFNKLEFGSDWDDNPRDLAHLSHYAGEKFERLINWQIVNLQHPASDLHDSPVLYLSGRRRHDFTDEEIDKLRTYVLQGGMLFGEVHCGDKGFEASFRKLGAELFPGMEFRYLQTDHPLFTQEVQFPVSPPPPMMHLHNGVRTLMLLSPRDLSTAWHRNRHSSEANAFRLGCNIYLYAVDRTKITSRMAASPTLRPTGTGSRPLAVARVAYNGNWDPEPFGWERLRTYLGNETDIDLRVVRPARFDQPNQFDGAKLAHMTGTGAFTLTDAQLAGLRAFLKDGGTLIADAAAGSEHSDKSFRAMVRQATGGQLVPWRLTLPEIRYRRAVESRPAGEAAVLERLMIGERPAVLYSRLDLSAGLLGTPIFGCKGYEPDSALRIMRHLLDAGAGDPRPPRASMTTGAGSSSPQPAQGPPTLTTTGQPGPQNVTRSRMPATRVSRARRLPPGSARYWRWGLTVSQPVRRAA